MLAGGAWTEARPPRVSKIGPALSSSNTIRRRPSADPVQKHAPGNGYGAKKGLTSRGPLQKQTLVQIGNARLYNHIVTCYLCYSASDLVRWPKAADQKKVAGGRKAAIRVIGRRRSG